MLCYKGIIMKGPVDWRKVVSEVYLRNMYTPEEVVKLLEPIRSTPSKQVSEKVNSFIKRIGDEPVFGNAISHFYRTEMGWMHVGRFVKFVGASYKDVIGYLSKHTNCVIRVKSGDSPGYLMCNPVALKRFGDIGDYRVKKFTPSKRLSYSLTKKLDSIGGDGFIRLDDMISKGVDYDNLSSILEGYRSKFDGAFLPSHFVILNDSNGKKVKYFNREHYDALLRWNRSGWWFTGDHPAPTEKFDISNLRDEVASNSRPQTTDLLTREQGYEFSNKYLTAVNELRKVESGMGLSASNMKKLVILLNNGHFKSFSTEKGKFSKSDLETRLSKVSDLEKIKNHYVNVLLSHNNRLIVKLVNRYLPRAKSLTFDDLFQEGSLGMMEAIKKYNPAEGVKFGTYATWWVRQAITRALTDKDAMIGKPIYVYELASKIKKLADTTYAQTGNKPTLEELAEKLDVPQSMITRSLDAMRQQDVESLNTPLYEGDDEEMETRVIDERPNPEEEAMSKIDSPSLSKWLSSILTYREKDILEMRSSDYTLEEIGKKYDLSRERIRQIEFKALEKLRKKSGQAQIFT